MPYFTVEQVMEIMNKPRSIRNMSVIAHVDHGKTTLTDSLIAFAGIISQEKVGITQGMDTDQEEKDRGITIKSSGISLYYEIDTHVSKKNTNTVEPYLINLIDCPGHVDFSSEVTAALRVTDGALVVVDFVEGVCVQTETVMRQALAEKIKPILMINKIDRGILELQVDGEEMYLKFCKVIESANVIISTYDTDEEQSIQVDPSEGNVAFGSALFGWAFSLQKFARIYSKKFNIEEKMLMKKFWGDNYYNPVTKKWQTSDIGSDGKKLKRGFVQFIMDPIIRLVRNIMDVQGSKKEEVFSMAEKLNLQLTKEDKEKEGKHLFRAVFMKWLNAADTLLEMIVTKLPSPWEAQKYRTQLLYEGPIDDPCGQGMQNCDPKGPLMIYISKMMKTSEKGRFIAFGRVFSGTVQAGQKVRIMGPNYVPGHKTDLNVISIQSTVLMMADKVERVSEVPCGNTVGLYGVDKYLVKSGTISDFADAHNIKPMKYSVSPVVRVAVQPKNAADLPKMIDALKNLCKVDPLVQCITEESGEHVVAGSGELHIEICMKELQNLARIPFTVSEPVVTYKETVSAKSSQLCLAKSQNRHNRIWMEAEPLQDEVVDAIEKKELCLTQGKEMVKKLQENFGWDQSDAKKIWCFGPDETGPNMIVDKTTSVQYLLEIKDSTQSAFQWVTKEGPLTQENLRGVKFNIMDVSLIADAIHRGGGQIIPQVRRVCYASHLTAQPRFQEPMYLCEIQSEQSCVSQIYQCLSQRRGIIVQEEPQEGTPIVIVKAYLPVAESFGFTTYLRSQTSGRAYPQCIFDHWAQIDSDPYEQGSKAQGLVDTIRKRKGLSPGIPALEQFLDKL